MPNICQRLPWLVSFWQFEPIRLQHYANVIFVFNRPFSFQIKRIHKKGFNGKLANPLLCVYDSNLIAASTFILNSRVAFAYNSPFVLLSSISFFMVFTSRKEYRNNFINFIAPASFMVYLLHKSPYFWLKLKNTLLNFSTEYDNFIFMTVCISLFIAIYILSTIIGIIYNELSKEVEKLFRFRTRQ